MDKNFLDYRPAHIVKGKNNFYVSYSVVNPATGKMTDKRIKLNYIHDKRQRKQYAEELIKKINEKLCNGFNPFLTTDNDKLITLSEALKAFWKAKKREVETGIIKAATYEDYEQQLSYFQKFIKEDCFLYQIKKVEINKFLDDIYINKQLSAITRNHYLQTLRTFFNYAVNHGFVNENPAKDIQNVRHGEKKRRAIPENVLQMIFNFLQESGDNSFLLACYLLYSCFIRPSEICGLKIKDLSFKSQTIFISAFISKNKKNQVVTMPKNVVQLMIDLNIYNYPSEFYIIGKDFKPSEKKCTDKLLRQKWIQIRKALKLPDVYQFYSLKDSGITKMINILNVSEVRDQARHSSISITDVYTDRSKTDGNERIKDLDFKPTF